ncbi:hypothetical protein HanPI659440_Chr07g0264541 [Helianthus annuus]|nr:hypothetical protein HanPI659440_Chr07g0264541 [Helianthus annuus]
MVWVVALSGHRCYLQHLTLLFSELIRKVTFLLFFLLFLQVIPEYILPKSYDYTSNDIISTINIGNKTFHVKIETLDGKVGFTNGIDVIVAQFELEAGCYLLFTKFFGNYFHVRIFGKNGVENMFADVEVDEAVVAPIDAVAEPAVDEQPDGHLYKFVRMASTDFVSFNIIFETTKY